jgi:DNA-binding YbaB/EbfC family protein
MKNLGNMLKQAQQMQERMAELQEEMGRTEVTGQALGGMVKVTLNLKGEMRGLEIDPTLLEDREMLEDMIRAAHNDAHGKADTQKQEGMQEEMRKLTGGLPLPPGFKLPF